LRLRRIKKAMNEAADNGRIFHLWWHPHNFGKNTKMNLAFLELILRHYHTLRQERHCMSLNLAEIAA
jgi:hypothetical protein